MRWPWILCAACIVGACSSEKKAAPSQTARDTTEPERDGASGPDASPTRPPKPVDAAPDAAAPRAYKHYDVNHVLSTGQSDSVANGASPFL
ncbi:MAG: hypothetical protein KF894_13255, partial [Labilithrix sp.]|nr:hypothetical protein [Labilithrix sp.]